jgi:lipopolysaccharide/colanic/teichoic acid biosynthesis glycosyltransferase
MGRYGRPFHIWKFRTMRSGISGTKITASEDIRVTAVGRWLRQYKLDELPQLFNVLLGDMSLIGPRPEVPAFVDLADPAWRAVLRVRPGITDAASLLYRDEEAILGGRLDPESYYRDIVLPEKLALNLRHLASRGPVNDFKLLSMTVRCSFFPSTLNARRLRKALHSEGVNRE